MNARDVFITCPFTDDYTDNFRAIVFTVLRSGFVPRCAREHDDGGEVRYDKICRIIGDCAYGIHDISKTEPDSGSGLPRFNMPFELGLFLGATKFGLRNDRAKKTMILDREKFRFQQFLSDIAGQDIHSHEGKIDTLIAKVATWLRDHGRQPGIPGGAAIAAEFHAFTAALPSICAALSLDPGEVTFNDSTAMVANWISPPA